MQSFNSIKTEKQLMQNAVQCFTPQELYELEQDWFQYNQSYGLMQQAAWQILHWLKSHFSSTYHSILIFTGSGNNGGDGWQVASFIQKFCPNWLVTVIEVEPPATKDSQLAKSEFDGSMVSAEQFLAIQNTQLPIKPSIIIDALFGIGLNRKPNINYKKIIDWINDCKQTCLSTSIISLDVPSGVHASTGVVFENIAIKADFTLCLIARKIGLHLKDSKDYVGNIIDLPLMPVNRQSNIFYLTQLPRLPKRQQVSHKGTYGHVLIIGGNQLQNGQGMAGATLIAATSAFATGIGKLTVACHPDFHSSIITDLPNAMTADLTNQQSICELIENVDIVALGMGLGRDKGSYQLFKVYIEAMLKYQKICLIDADGLYHLAHINQGQSLKDKKLIKDIAKANWYFTPHAGEAGMLLNQEYQSIDNDKLFALSNLKKIYGGNWLIKGAETIISEQQKTLICGLGNAGMATAGMGDSLAGVVSGLLAQKIALPLTIATLIHAKAGDLLASQVGEYALQAKEMPQMIGHVIDEMTKLR